MRTNFTAAGKVIESACKGYEFRKSSTMLTDNENRTWNAIFADIERFEPKSPEWVAACKRNADKLNILMERVG